MKFLVLVSCLMIGSAFAAPTEKKIAKPVEKTPKAIVLGGVPGEKIIEEDCDDKAKKKVEIKPEGLSLSNNSAGCSLDDAK